MKMIKTPKLQKKNREAGNTPKTNQFITTILIFAVYAVLLVLFFKFVIILGNITSPSMEPTLMTGDKAFYYLLAYKFHKPERGDIVYFDLEELGADGKNLCKRIIGLPGETVSFVDGHVLINGNAIVESYISDDVETYSWLTFTVPEDCYFMLGDNRTDSFDSRYWINPYINISQIKGKYLCTVWKASKK